MKNIYLSFLPIMLLILVSCSTNSESQKIPDKGIKDSSPMAKIKKIIKTKTYKAKPYLDKFVPDEPIYYNLGYDRTIGQDFCWNVSEYDGYGNLVGYERFLLDENGKEKMEGNKTTNEYYSAKDNKLSSIYKNGETNVYIRDDKGLLLEIKRFFGDELYGKTVITNNSVGQRIKMEIFEENSIVNSETYTYDQPDLEKGKMASKIVSNFGKFNFKEEFYYEEYKEDLNVRYKRKLFQDGGLYSEQTHYISNKTFKNTDGTTQSRVYEELVEGYNKPNDRPRKETFLCTFNSHDELIEYKRYSEYINTKQYPDNSVKETKIKSPFQVADDPNPKYITQEESDGLMTEFSRKIYKCDYNYNEKGDWVELIFTECTRCDQIPGNVLFIVKREITYL